MIYVSLKTDRRDKSHGKKKFACSICGEKSKTMKANLGTTDRTIRIMAAIITAVLYFTGAISGTTAIILLVLAGILILTSLRGYCPLYYPFKIKTTKK